MKLVFLLVVIISYINYMACFHVKPKILKHRFGSLKMADKTPLVAQGKRVEADPGSSLMAACKKLGLNVPTKCKKGECGTCTVTVAGQKIRACVGKVPPAPKLKSLKEKGLSVSVDYQ